LNVAKGGVELEVRFEVTREEKLDLHGALATVLKHNLLAVELFIHEHIHVVLWLLDVDRHVDTPSFNHDRNRLRVVLILEEQSEVLLDVAQLVRDVSELNPGLRVSFDLCSPLERHLGDEFIKDLCFGQNLLAFFFL